MQKTKKLNIKQKNREWIGNNFMGSCTIRQLQKI